MAGVSTIPFHAPFLPLLAEGLLAAGEDRLADTLVLLPSRRACLALRDLFVKAARDRPLLLPRLQPVGEVELDELILDAADAPEPVPAIGQVRRQLLLTLLVLAQAPIDALGRRQMPHEQAARLAAELAGFLDEMQNEELPFDRLETLVEGDLAEHWQDTLRFLRILAVAWPPVLAERRLIDPALARNRLLHARAERWRRQRSPQRVIAAGSLGTLPAVRDLLAVVAALPNGTVVLPGLDLELEEASWQRLDATHPQYALQKLLQAIGIERAAVRPWPLTRPDRTGEARSRLLATALRPTATSNAWQNLPPLPASALAGMTLVESPDLATEALDLALRLRMALEVPGKEAVLVTSDRNLARRVAVELRRWQIEVDDSAGVPLDQSPPGGFLLLLAHMLANDAAPLPLLQALKHPLCRGGMAEGEMRRHVRALERALLRGPRIEGGLDGLLRRLDGWGDDEPWPAPIARPALRDWLAGLALTCRPLARLMAGAEAPMSELVAAHLLLAERLAADAEGDPSELWAKAAGEALARFTAELIEAAPDLGLVPRDAYPALLAILMGRIAVRPRAPRHPRLRILGQLESRLADADLVLIGGLNEGVWPRAPEAGPWLSRQMRRQLGLPPLEQQIGIAAHDFQAAASAGEVVLSRSLKDEQGAPTTPSRWLARLGALLRASGRAADVRPPGTWSAMVHALDVPPTAPRACPRPRPQPPLAARPRALSVTEIEQLMRDPYAVYARRILMLRALEPLDADPGAAERGQLIHQAIEQFVRRHPDRLPDEPLPELIDLGRQIFEQQADRPQVMALWWPRFIGIARWFIAQEQARRAEIATVKAEIEGQLTLRAPGGPFRIRARADRLEQRHDGMVAIVDYKTGRLPDAGDVRAGLAPQLPLEAAILIEGGFAGLPPADLAGLALWALKGGETGGEARDPTLYRQRQLVSPGELARQAIEGATRLVAHFDHPDAAYIAVPRPEIAPAYNDYEHLARIAEWRDSEDEVR